MCHHGRECSCVKMKTIYSDQPFVFFSAIANDNIDQLDVVSKERDAYLLQLNSMQVAFCGLVKYVIIVVSFGLPMFEEYCVSR